MRTDENENPSSARGLTSGRRPRKGLEKFVRDFVAAWAKVSDLDRYDLR